MKSMFLAGKQTIVEVYQYFDRPLLYAAKDETERLYLVVWIGDEGNADIWLYSPLSPKRFRAVRSGATDLRSAFQDAEGGCVFKVWTDENGECLSELAVRTVDLVDDMLPEAGHTLADVSENLTASDAISLHFDVPKMVESQIPAQLLGKVLDSFQHLLDNLAWTRCKKAGKPKTTFRDLRRKTELVFVESRTGSFCADLKGSAEGDMFGLSVVGSALELFFELLAVGSDEDMLREKLRTINDSRSISSYREFLQRVSTRGSSLSVGWAPPKPNKPKRAELSFANARSAFETLIEIERSRPIEFNVRSKLIGIHLRTRRFELDAVEEDRRYAGRISDSALKVAEEAEFKKIYQASLKEVYETTKTGQSTALYTLLSLTPLD